MSDKNKLSKSGLVMKYRNYLICRKYKSCNKYDYVYSIYDNNMKYVKDIETLVKAKEFINDELGL